MKIAHDLSKLNWKLSGWTPFSWAFMRSMEVGAPSLADIPPVPAEVPGSVQEALRSAGVLPDWNLGLNARACDWVENRHWIFEAELPKEWFGEGASHRLHCLGLDYAGWILVSGKEVGAFRGSFVPHTFDLSPHLSKGQAARLEIIFDCPPRWLGQFGYTSQMTDWKPRFNYTWDWTSRLVQTGIWDGIFLEIDDGNFLGPVLCETGLETGGGHGRLRLQGKVFGPVGTSVVVKLTGPGGEIMVEEIARTQWEAGRGWSDLPVAPWHPNGMGDQPLYELVWQLRDAAGGILDEGELTVGFKNLQWEACEGAPAAADPWICRVNGDPVFLQGVNWTPIRPNFADLRAEDYRQRLELYRDIGCNILRVWGGAFLEKDCFYRLCDELGLLVWQELPLSSSGLENWPPEDARSIAAMEEIARSYVCRRRHHVSLALWCGGNELQGAPDGGKVGVGKPIDLSHPMMVRVGEVVRAEDPSRRFVAASSSGPRFGAEAREYGQGLHWDVHGPWKAEGPLEEQWNGYWAEDDALLRSETGAPGASPADIVREFAGGLSPMPPSLENPLWRRTAWWVEWPEFLKQGGARDCSLEEYVAWSQGRQAEALATAARACRSRFPKCGGFIVWMGHDSFPCTANTAIVDFHGRPKPAALALKKIFLGEEGR